MSAFSSLDLFYELDDRRRRSPQIDYGYWRWSGEPFRLTWLDWTGELIAVRLSHGPRNRAIRIATHADGLAALVDDERMEVYVAAVLRERDEVEELLDGWPEFCEQPESLAWIVGRCRGRSEALTEWARPRIHLPDRRRAR